MANVDRIRLIEAYYQGSLSGEEKVFFKQLMKEDNGFKTTVKEFKDIFGGLDALHVEHFQVNLKNLSLHLQLIDQLLFHYLCPCVVNLIKLQLL